jgi:acyl-CoA reductase-like NAD-dependent aldehyde dehydrogenase
MPRERHCATLPPNGPEIYPFGQYLISELSAHPGDMSYAVRTARTQIIVENPATGEVVAEVSDLDADDIGALVQRARAAQPAWEALGFRGRNVFLSRCRRWVVTHEEELIQTMLQETGKVYEDAQLEVMYIASLLAFWEKHASKYLKDERIPIPRSLFVVGRSAVVRRAPIGVVGVIGPWNFPLANSFSDCIPPLAAGNAVVLKPSEVTPLSSLKMAEMVRECGLPDGIFQVATGRGGTGSALVDRADGVMFTGSVKTGRLVMERAAKSFKPVCLEMGGKDPMIVLAGANLERAANAAVYWGMINSGQMCFSVERIYVEAPAYDEFIRHVEKKVKALRHGASTEPGVSEVGAIIFQPQLRTITAHVEDAVAKGARILIGGKVKSGIGQYFEPTVLVDVDHTMDCMRAETFGPTLPIMKVRDADEAIELANDSDFGLGASIWASSTKRGRELARRIESGVVCVNDQNVSNFDFSLPQVGWKSSGLGGRHSADGIKKWTRAQTIMTTHVGLTKEIYHYPHTRLAMNLRHRMMKLLYGR